MAASLERFQALVENSPDVISLVDATGAVLYASAATATVLGYQPEELLGRNGLDLLHPEDRDPTLRVLKKVLEEPQWPNRIQARIRQKDGQWRWVESTASNLLDEPHVGAIVINYREIDARRAEEQEMHRLAQELLLINAELNAFAHTIAHDLREPLRTISACTEILVRHSELDESHRKTARFIVDGVERMSTLLDNLLSSATSQFTNSLRPVELEHAASLAMQNLQESLATSCAVVTMGPLPEVQGHESDLVRVFQNLISNAVKYRTDAPVEVHISAERVGADWIIRVRDNGTGIPKEHHQRVFGLFKRVHAGEIPGSGIGLAVCKKIVESLGGTIWVDSEPGAGSTFCFTIAAETLTPGA
jgi:PAS domain S-box-containing protein